jgi:bifunctional ADP-heptose synthase (sugar kinase/adenylyltransferase)
MLQHAASFCDDLIVAVDSDALIRARYGAGLPICPYEERAAVVAALDCVWRVVEIPMTETGESCLPAILDLLHPSVYICRSEEAVPEIEAAYKAHAKIVRLPRHGRRSSTEIARAIVRWADGKSG